MRDRRSVMVIILLVALSFWAGISWEREDCRLVWPDDPDRMDRILRCRDFTTAIQDNR